MNIKNCIFFTEVITILSEKGEEKLAKATSKKSGNDEHDLDWYDRMGIKPPKELEEDYEIDENGMLTLGEGEFTYDFSTTFLDMTDFFRAVEADEFGAIIEFNDGKTYWVEEDVFEVYARIYYAQRSWFEILKDSVLEFFERFKNKKQIIDDGKQN